MRAWVCVLAALAVVPRTALAGTFDDTGHYAKDERTLFIEDFESAASLSDRGSFVGGLGDPDSWERALLVMEPRFEGNRVAVLHAEHDDMLASLVLGMPPQTGRLEVRAWVRPDVDAPAMEAIYADNAMGQVAVVAAYPTGRRTSDFWLELSTGPLDATVLGVPLSRVELRGWSAQVDAVELVRVDGDPVDGRLCDVHDEAERCGSVGTCLFGTCVDGAAVYGPMPLTREHRKEYVGRVIHLLGMLNGSRDVVTRLPAFRDVLEKLPDVDGARAFWEGIHAEVGTLHDHHTWGPMKPFTVLPSTWGYGTGSVNACFGWTELDLAGRGQGFTVFRSLNAELQVGDILVDIDGEPALEWAARAARWGAVPPSDPAAAPSWLAIELAGLMTTRAVTATFERCETAVSCTAPTRFTLRLPTGAAGLSAAYFGTQLCDGRFLDSAGPTFSGSIVSTLPDEILRVQFNDFFIPSGAFAIAVAGSSRMLVDARLGLGGYISGVVDMAAALREPQTQYLCIHMPRPGRELSASEAQSLVDTCGSLDFVAGGECDPVYAMARVPADDGAPVPKVAWLNAADVSSNDMITALLRGRGSTRVFAPHPTSGAFGTNRQVPSVLPGLMQDLGVAVSDVRCAPSLEGLASAPFESGHGVAPDEVVTQKLSDALQGRDTLVERALAWLREAP